MAKTNNLCADIGYLSINHVGEQLCGDHVEVIEQGEDSHGHRACRWTRQRRQGQHPLYPNI